MRHQIRIAVVSLAAGFGLAGLLQVAALLATQAGSAGLVRWVDWPTTVLQTLTSSSGVAIFGGLPLGGFAYAIVVYLILRKALAAD